MERWEAGSLFLGITLEKANRSIVAVCQFLVNHFFEVYGVEVGAVVAGKWSRSVIAKVHGRHLLWVVIASVVR